MAISGPSSYVPTANEFIAHWQSVNAALGVGNEVTLAGGTTVAMLTSQRDALTVQRDALEAALNGVEIASALIKQRKAALIARFQQFVANVRAVYSGSAYEAALPDQPNFSDAESRFIAPLADIENLWERINNAEGALTLVGGYGQGAFNDDVDDLREEYMNWVKAQSDVKIARAQRNALQDKIYPILKQYRQIIPGKFEAGSPYIETLPRLSPKAGATPEPVNASATWDAAEVKARIVFDASDEADLKEYELRYTPGDEYESDDETVVAKIAPDAPREFLTDAGLTQPGAASTFKVYVILNTGNERGSAAMTVERPLE